MRPPRAREHHRLRYRDPTFVYCGREQSRVAAPALWWRRMLPVPPQPHTALEGDYRPAPQPEHHQGWSGRAERHRRPRATAPLQGGRLHRPTEHRGWLRHRGQEPPQDLGHRPG